MTTAMCTECGSFRAGLFCPCPNCPRPTPKEAGQGFYFTDWHYSMDRLSEFSDVIKALRSAEVESSQRRLALWRYIQRYYPEPDGGEMDAMAVESADRLLETINADRIHRKRVLWGRVHICLGIILLTYCALRLLHFV